MSSDSYYFEEACKLHANSDVILSRGSEFLYHAYRSYTRSSKAFPEGFNMHFFYLCVSKVIACIAKRSESFETISAIDHAAIRSFSDTDLDALKAKSSAFIVESVFMIDLI